MSIIRIFRIIKLLKAGMGLDSLKDIEKTLESFYRDKGVID